MKDLKEHCENGLSRLGDQDSPKRVAAARRLDDELALLEHHDHIPLLTTLADITDFARSNGIGVGPGRGSVGGSLAAFLSGVTMINPVAHGLAFGPFLDTLKKPSGVVQLDAETSGWEAIRHYMTTTGLPAGDRIRVLPSADLDLLFSVVRQVWPARSAHESLSQMPLDDHDVLQWIEQLLPDGRFVSRGPAADRLRESGFRVRSFADVVHMMAFLHFPDNHSEAVAHLNKAHLTGLAMTTYWLTFLKMHHSTEFETVFNELIKEQFLPFNQIDEDPTRHNLDRLLLVDVLGLNPFLCRPDGPIDLLRRKLAAEPQISGNKKTKVKFTR